MRSTLAGFCLGLTMGCGDPIAPVDPAPAGTYVIGDYNGDGWADASDAVALSSRLFRSGPASSCFSASDVVPDGEINASDMFTLMDAVLLGSPDMHAIDPEECAGAPAATLPEAARFALSLEAPRRASAAGGKEATVKATVDLSSPDRDVMAWSLSMVAEGCAVSAPTTVGTDADFAVNGGQRSSQSYDYRALTSGGGGVAGVVLDWRGDGVLEAREDPWTLLEITATATAPSKGCEPCVLRLEDGQRATGPAQRNMVTVDGWTFPIPGVEVSVKICAD